MSEYYNYNGKTFPVSEACYAYNSRVVRFGDSLFESMRIDEGVVKHFPGHYKRLQEAAKFLKLNLHYDFTESYFLEQIYELAEKNNCRDLARCRLTVFRSGTGFYQPESDDAGFLIECFKAEKLVSPEKQDGLKIGIFTELYKPNHRLSNFKTGNSLIFVLASRFCKERGFDDVILLNQKGMLCEGTSSNLFIVKNNILYTPALNQGCIMGIYRDLIIQKAREEFYKVQETFISLEMLLSADEAFLCNAGQGIRWIKSFQDKTYERHLAVKLFRGVSE